ncbi:hypothetical protein ACN28I_21330 [Archangium gephyra]|uniref:hypothetical protein n=1 Tax=Archangium gephyra TaxID=48 RepID=UPI003B76AB30
MNRFFAGAVLALSLLVGCGGDDDTPGDGNPGGGTQQPCSASNCTGCCFNNTCQTGNTASACGKAGAACMACGSSKVCKTDQTCGVDPNSVWRVQPVSARIASSDNGTYWDGDDSAPDVVVSMRCPGSTTYTQTPEVESYTPAWTSGGCTAKASQLLAEPWVFQLWDIDFSSDDTITDSLALRITEEFLTAGTVTLNPSGGMTSMTVQLQKQP